MKKNALIRNRIIYIIFLMIIFLSIGYATFNSSGYIKDINATVRVSADIRVSGVLISESSNRVISNYVNYDVKSISSEVYLPYNDSSITYKVSITNFESPEMGIFNITGLPDYLEYSISGYSLKDKICNSNGKCNLGITKDIYITIGYKNGINNSGVITHNFDLLFDFRNYHEVNYKNIYGIDYPIEVINGDKLVLDLEYDDVSLAISNSVGYNYVLGIDYEYEDGIVNIFDVSEDLYIDVNDKILITNVNFSSDVEIIKYFGSRIESKITLSESSSQKTSYDITIYNSSNDNFVYTGVNYDEYDNDNITLSLLGLKIGDLIESGESIQFSLVYKYVDDVNFNSEGFSNILNSFLNFNFKKCYDVTYENVSGTHVNYAIANETFTVTFTSSDPIEIKMGGTTLVTSDYTFTNKVLTIPNVTGALHIRKKLPYTITNLVKNGSFENGLNNWTVRGTASYWQPTPIAHIGSSAYYRKPSSALVNYISQDLNWVNGNKYYYFVHGISTTNQNLHCDVANRGGSIKVTVNPNYWSRGSSIFIPNFTGSNQISINYAEITTDVIVDSIGVINLTSAFGSGNEPSKEWCDSNINYFDGSMVVYK